MRGEISRGESEAPEAARGEWELHETCGECGEPSSSPLSSARRLAAASLSTPAQPSSSRLEDTSGGYIPRRLEDGDTFFCAATTAIAISATAACDR